MPHDPARPRPAAYPYSAALTCPAEGPQGSDAHAMLMPVQYAASPAGPGHFIITALTVTTIHLGVWVNLLLLLGGVGGSSGRCAPAQLTRSPPSAVQAGCVRACVMHGVQQTASPIAA